MEPVTARPSFGQVAGELTRPLLHYLERLARDASLAQDLLQETLLKIANGLASFDGRSSVRTWAFAIATNVAMDHLRKPERRLRMVDVGEAGDVPDPAAPLEDRIVVDEMNACVRQVIDGLPPEFRAALVLHDLEGLTAEQTAQACGCTVATAKIRIHRSRARLKQALQRQCAFYRDGEGVFRCERRGGPAPQVE